LSSDRRLHGTLRGLTVVTGIVDAVSFLALGHVFTANMTGNVVFLGFAAAGAPGLSVARSLAALASFIAGAVLGGRLGARMAEGPRHRWSGIAFGAEAAILVAAALIVAGRGSDLSGDARRAFALIVLTGTAMGIRNATVRRLGVPDLTTTVLTLTITGLGADSPLAGGQGAGSGRRIAAVAAMFGGAALGALLLQHSVALPLGVAGGLSAACAFAAVQPSGSPA
jgi:uncharacterized membrane protein YoaK (UPF0700 family)